MGGERKEQWVGVRLDDLKLPGSVPALTLWDSRTPYPPLRFDVLFIEMIRLRGSASGLWGQTVWIWTSALPVTSRVPLSKLLHLSVPHFLQLSIGNQNSIYLMRLLWRFNEIIHVNTWNITGPQLMLSTLLVCCHFLFLSKPHNNPMR